MKELSPNTKAILLLTAPLIAGRNSAAPDILTPGEYKRLTRRLRELQRQPADFLSDDSPELQRECNLIIEESRLQRLLGRGFLLSQVVERWQARAIWVISRADPQYPRCLKLRLKEDAPAVLYGCGEIDLLGAGGLAVVGSRNVDQALIEYAMGIGRLAANAGKTIVSGGARGIDQAAMFGALNASGKVTGILADSLEKTVMNREQRNFILNGQLLLVSPYDPGAGFNVGNAMQRNKLIYALADAALVVASDYNKGGTWAGAIEQLTKLHFVPVFVRMSEEKSMGLEALLRKGARPWTNPQDVDAFKAVFDVPMRPGLAVAHESTNGIALFTYDEPVATALTAKESKDNSQRLLPTKAISPAAFVFIAVREAVRLLLKTPMNEAEVAAALGVSNAQAKAWLQRLVDENEIQKKGKLFTYQPNQQEVPADSCNCSS